jgi:DNA-binding CsgD family transcriptional regulator
LDRAMNRYTTIGSRRDSSRVRSRLRQLNGRSHPRGHDRRSGVPSLTATEYAVAKLVAEGFTNGQAGEQLSLSHHTVAFHLRKIFSKLGVASRVQLAAIWSNLDVSTTAS